MEPMTSLRAGVTVLQQIPVENADNKPTQINFSRAGIRPGRKIAGVMLARCRQLAHVIRFWTD